MEHDVQVTVVAGKKPGISVASNPHLSPRKVRAALERAGVKFIKGGVRLGGEKRG
jgi:hypothetical protein